MQRPTPIVQVPVPPPTPGRLPQLTLKPTARTTIPPPAPAVPKITLPPLTPVPKGPKIVPKYPYTQEQIAHCSLDEEGNIIDPITQEPILPGRVVSVKEDNTYYCFDIATLYREVREGRTNNPFTRRPLSQKILDEVREYKKELEIRVLPMLQYNAFEIDRDRPLGELVLDLIRAMSMNLSAVTKYNFFIGDDSVYNFDLNKTLEEQKLFTEETLTGHQNVLIIPERDPTDHRIRAMYRYLKMYGPTGTLSSFIQEFPQVETPEDRRIRLQAEQEAAREAELAARTPPRRTPPQRQPQTPPPRLPEARLPSPRTRLPVGPRQPMDRDIAMGIVSVLNEDYTVEGAPPVEILQTAYDALRNYTVTANIAHEMENALNPNLRRNLYQVLHIIYAAVSDKNNLREGYGVEGYYAGRPQGPNYYNISLNQADLENINLY